MSFPSQRDVQSRINTNSPARKWRAFIPVAISLAIFCKNNPTGGRSSCKLFPGKNIAGCAYRFARRISPNERRVYTLASSCKGNVRPAGKLRNEIKSEDRPGVDGDNFGNSRKLVTKSIIVYRRLHAFVKIKVRRGSRPVFVAPKNLNLHVCTRSTEIFLGARRLHEGFGLDEIPLEAINRS